MPNENRRRAARSGWTRRRGTAASAADVDEDSSRDIEAAYAAYRAAKAKHDAAIAALREAARLEAPDEELVKRQAEAAVEEIEALSALRARVRSPMKPDEL